MSDGLSHDRAQPMLLAPKFRPPQLRKGYVRRERLHVSLSRATSTGVMLVSAPAGCGKTALVADWLTDLPRERWAWLSLDSRDNDLVRVWSYLIEALHSLTDGSGSAALQELVRSRGQGPTERWLGLLVNELAAVDQPTSYLVVDDLHLITDPEIRTTITFFVASMPSWLRLIIVTRADPPLPAPRLRAEGRLVEIRQSDLRFDSGEAATLFRAEGIDNLSDDQLQWLMNRTEGWAAGLQLAAIVLGDSPGADRLLQIVGTNRTFADYIISEVVDVVSDDMRRFLFTTSILDRVSPSLATAVSGLDDAGAILRDAQRRGLFIVALDDHDEWYRYHALFAEAVLVEARLKAPELLQLAHEAAATWFENQDDPVLALDHWFAAGRPDEALRIVVPAVTRLLDAGQVNNVERIARLIPPSVVGNDAVRQLDYAELHYPIDTEVTRWWVDQAEATIAGLAVPDAALARRHQGVRAVSDLLFGEWDDAAKHATAAIDPNGVANGDLEVTARAGLQLIRAKGWLDEPDDARALFRIYEHNHRGGPAVRSFIAPNAWALAAAIGGYIREAARLCSRDTTSSPELGMSQVGYQELLLARAIVERELRHTEAVFLAIDQLRSAPLATYHSVRTMADVELAMACIDVERHDEAARVLDDLDRVEHPRALGPRIYDAIDRAWTELHLSTGDIIKASRSADRLRVGFWRDATLAKVHLAAGDSDRAAGILSSLSPTSPRQHVTLGLLHALALANHDPMSSLANAAGAIKIAATEGMVQTVIAVGPGVADLLEGGSWAAPDGWTDELRLILAKAPAGPTTGRVPTLYEQPSERERAVARYLASRLTVAEIAREMGVSTNTLKTHVSALYRKLEVNSRKEFVAKARRLGVIG